MPWTTPSLRTVREMVRDDVTSMLSGAVLLGNSVLRVMADAMGGLAHLVLRYIDWLAQQLLPDTAETEWLDRHGDIWLVNSDGSIGRKNATYAQGSVTFTGLAGIPVPEGTQLSTVGIYYETLETITLGTEPTEAIVRAVNSGLAGNLAIDDEIDIVVPLSGVDNNAVVVSMEGGTDAETDAQLRGRILQRIQNPPMGGDAEDYIRWALACPGVTRAWCQPQSQGVGSVTVRFLMDDVHGDNYGLPTSADLEVVRTYIDQQRPVTVKDCFVYAPIPLFYDMTIRGLVNNNSTVRARIENSIKTMEKKKSYPGGSMYRAWVDEAISAALGEEYHELTFETVMMPSQGYMPILGTIVYAG